MTTENASFRLQSLANAEVRRRLPMRAKVQVAPAARLRPQQRLRGRLHGLVPLSLLLLLPVRTKTKCLSHWYAEVLLKIFLRVGLTTYLGELVKKHLLKLL